MNEHTTLELLFVGFVADNPLIAWPMLAIVTLGATVALVWSIVEIVRTINENRIRSMSVRGFRRRKAELSR